MVSVLLRMFIYHKVNFQLPSCSFSLSFHILSDIVFFIYLYQRWIYRVDMKHVNEFGTSGNYLICVNCNEGYMYLTLCYVNSEPQRFRESACCVVLFTLALMIMFLLFLNKSNIKSGIFLLVILIGYTNC